MLLCNVACTQDAGTVSSMHGIHEIHIATHVQGACARARDGAARDGSAGQEYGEHNQSTDAHTGGKLRGSEDSHAGDVMP
jgi:hypothetical protein